MLEALICPQSHSTLSYDADAQEVISTKAKLAFPIRNGIPIMLIDEAEAVSDDDHAALLARAEAEGIAPTFEA